MRILTCAAVALLLCAPPALAHQGSPNFLSQVDAIAPAVKGVTVTVLNRDDRLLLQNTSGKDVVIEGYDGEPYARVDADGGVYVNRDSKAAYINEERDGNVDAPDGVDGDGPPRWEQTSQSGRFEWHDHRMHWMLKGDPKEVKDKDVRTKVFDWHVPLRVDGRKAEISGTLFWTPVEPSDLPLAAIFAGAALVIALSIAVVIVRRRRSTTAPAEAW